MDNQVLHHAAKPLDVEKLRNLPVNKRWFHDVTLLEYINTERRGYFLPDMATNGLFLIDKTAYEVYEQPLVQLELAQVMNKTFESDFIYSLCDGIIFCETLGLEILKPDYDFPSVVSHPIASRAALAGLDVPDPYRSRRMVLNLESLNLIANHIDKPLYVSIQGPFTLAIQLAGATHLLRCIIDDPQFVRELLEFTYETVARYACAVERAGARMISLSEPASVTLNRERFEPLVVGNLNRIYDQLTCWKSLHICGDTSELLDLMLSCHLNAVSLDQIMDYTQVAPRIPDDIVLIGNLDPIELLGRGTPEQIVSATSQLVRSMKPYRSHYLCALGCNCTNDVPVKNLQAAINTARMPED